MTEILHDALPDDLDGPRPLPGVAPLAPDGWLRVDDAYTAQMAYRRQLLDTRRTDVLWQDADAGNAADEILDEALKLLTAREFRIDDGTITCPDGARVSRDLPPLEVLGRTLQEDICLLEKRGAEHVLTGACLCFPASWRLSEKAGRPLTAIHDPVPEYDAGIARRVQRLFDGVQPGRPLWRFNRLAYVDPDLHQPERKTTGQGNYIRSERQSILRMPRTQPVVFTIHSYVVRTT
ncbi:DUF3445 domain-containing protein [Sulfitobacter sp. D35]|uniref:heme-dependent oxidative N-demethylase family protein n=1 Tax=Sulfitobacter sp. D35 TaxID=3083252 RepID=UPI00296F1D61|nr:DUF3445 domain-containing protein [Sulfitobacter sp. D35]MDW4496696.1 DUF3445 domain-containing protein [Sulfitobacter sp. D35]